MRISKLLAEFSQGTPLSRIVQAYEVEPKIGYREKVMSIRFFVALICNARAHQQLLKKIVRFKYASRRESQADRVRVCYAANLVLTDVSSCCRNEIEMSI